MNSQEFLFLCCRCHLIASLPLSFSLTLTTFPSAVSFASFQALASVKNACVFFF